VFRGAEFRGPPPRCSGHPPTDARFRGPNAGKINKLLKLVVQKSVVSIELPPRFGEYLQPVSECLARDLRREVERLV
jgi:hypothetical protein